MVGVAKCGVWYGVWYVMMMMMMMMMMMIMMQGGLGVCCSRLEETWVGAGWKDGIDGGCGGGRWREGNVDEYIAWPR